MKDTITYSVFLVAVLIATVGLVTTINEYPDFAYVIAFILLSLLGGMGVKRFLDDRRIKQKNRVGKTSIQKLNKSNIN